MKYYFIKGGDTCYTLEAHLDFMREHEIEKMTVYRGKRVLDSNFFYCKKFNEVGERGDCSVLCKKYIPNNGENGRCTHWGYTYEETEETFDLCSK